MQMATLKFFSAILLALLLHQLPTVSTNHCSETENSFLWKVNTTPPVYLFGTLHLPYNTLWDVIPGNVKAAFSSSSDVHLELRLSNSETSESLEECQLLPNGKLIDEILPSDLVTRIENYLESLRRLFPSWLDESLQSSFFRGGLSNSDHLFAAVTQDWKRKKPIWVLNLLSALTEESIRQREKPMLDRFLDNAARHLGKELTALETVNDHCQPFNRLKNDQVETVLRIQLDYLETLPMGPPDTIDRDLTEYICGNLRGLIDSQSILPLPPLPQLSNITNITAEERSVLLEVEAQLYNRLVTRRNRRMTRTLDILLKKQRSEPIFVAIGAGHLIGSKSIVDRLRRKDYVVDHVDISETIDGPSLPNNIVALGDPGSVTQSSRILDLPEELNYPAPSRLQDLSGEDLDTLMRRYNIGGSREQRSTFHHREQRQSSTSDTASSAQCAAPHHRALLLSALALFTVLNFSRLH